MPFWIVVIGFLVVMFGWRGETEGERGFRVGSKWEFLNRYASGGMSDADWSKVILHRHNFFIL